jgi:hypothetical protein
MSDTPLNAALLHEFGGDKEAARRFLEELREQNEAAKARAEQRRQEEAAAQQAQAQARRDADNAERVVHFKAQAAAAWPGDAKSFEAAFPRLLAEWQTRKTLNALDATLERKRESYRNLL